MPPCDQTGTPRGLLGFLHFTSSVIPGSASRISARMRASVRPRQPPSPFPSSRIRWSMSREAGTSAAAPAFGGDLGLVELADLRGLLAADFGFALLIRVSSTRSD